MARDSRNNRVLVPQARKALDRFKYEIANELQLPTQAIQDGYWGDVTAREAGAVGGNMVKRMIQAAEQSLVQQAAAGVRAGFQEAFSSPQASGQTGAAWGQAGKSLNQAGTAPAGQSQQ